jgi:hypothetical protein
MATERAEFDIIVNGGMAQKSLDDVRARALGLGGGLDRVVGGLDRIGGKSGADAEKAVRSLGFALGNAGGRGSELLGVVGDLAGALSGGGLAIGLTAVALAAGKVYEAYQEAEAQSRAFSEAISATQQTAIDRATGRLQAYEERLKGVSKELRQFGMSAGERAIDDSSSDLRNAEGRLRSTRDALMRANDLALIRPDDQGNREALAGLVKREKLEAAQVATLRETIPKQEKLLDLSERQVEAAIQKREEAERLARLISDEEQARRREANEMQADLDANTQRERAIVKLAEEEAAAKETLRKFDEDRERAHAATLEDLRIERKNRAIQTAEEEAAAVIAIAEQAAANEQAVMLGLANATLGIAANSIDQLTTALIEGQDRALETFAVSVFKQAGTALIGLGIQTVGRGLAASSNPLTAALAPADFAMGGTLIGAGLALGGVGAGLGVGFGLTGAGGADGSSAGALSPARDPGAGSGGASPSTSGPTPAPVTVVFNYGVGPAPEKMARDLQRALSYGQAHRIIPRGGR